MWVLDLAKKWVKFWLILKKIVRLTIRVLNWECSNLALKTYFDDENMEFRMFRMIMEVQFCETKTHTHKKVEDFKERKFGYHRLERKW